MLELKINLGEGQPSLLFLATHFDFRGDNRERLASAKLINELVAEGPEPIALLAGDLNDVPKSEPLHLLSRKWTSVNETPLPTIPVEKPTKQIDYILFSPASRWKVIEAQVLSESVASDHRPLLTVLELQPALQK